MVLGLIMSGQPAVISGFWKLLLIVVAGEAVTLIADKEINERIAAEYGFGIIKEDLWSITD